MKIAVSNIAWRLDEENTIAELLVRKGISGVEVAPAKIGPDPTALGADRIRAYGDFWKSRDIAIVAMQALLFGKSQLNVFASAEARRQTLQYLSKIITLGGTLGAPILVFGSPRNRKRGDLSSTEAEQIAVRFFRELGERAADAGTCLCIEANPARYGCDFVTTTREAYELVNKVARAGFGLHVDATSMCEAGETADDLVSYGGAIRHFHASEPDLQPVVGTGPVNHRGYAQGLKQIGYAHWVSIEMREGGSSGDNSGLVARAIDFARVTYGS